MELRLFQFVCFGFLLISLESFKAQEITVDSSQTFTSANYPDNYPSNYNETWCFATNSNNRLLLSFVEIEIERKYDFIIVSESTAPSGDKQLLRWSGSGGESVPRVLSSGNNLCVYIQTDSKTNEKGFSGIVKVSDSFDDSCSGFDCKNGVCLGKDDRCNGFVNCGNGEDEMCNDTIVVNSGVEFKSMNYDDGGYGFNHHFTWYLTVNAGMRIEVQFNDVDIERDTPLDLILVGNGLDTRSNILLTWHGGVNASTLPKVRSSGSSMWVHFTSDETNNGRGFSATARSINTQEDIQCGVDFKCGNAVCIPQSAQCDGFQHCMQDPDEVNGCGPSCPTGERPCSDGKFCFTNDNLCGDSPMCLTDDYQNGCELTVTVEDRDVRLLRDFSQTINFTTNIPQTQLLINLFFIRTESRDVEVNLTVGENELTSRSLLQSDGIVNDYVLTQRSSGQVLWLKFDVKGSLLISANVLEEDYNFPPPQPSCPGNIFVEDGDEGVEWTSPLCNDKEDGELVSTCSPSSGDAFSDGETPVKCTCTDSRNLTSACNFTVEKTAIHNDVQVVPLLIGLTVVVVLIVLFAAYCLTSRIAKPKPDDELPLNVRNSGRAGGYQNTDVQQDVDLEPLTSTYERTVTEEGSQPQQTMYASIDESTPGGPGNPGPHDVDNTQQKRIYSEKLYNEGGRPIPPERDVSPGSSGVEQSPYYSRQLRSKYQNNA